MGDGAGLLEVEASMGTVYVTADAFHSKRRVLPFDESRLDIVLDRADF